jgi:hypothetical protein
LDSVWGLRFLLLQEKRRQTLRTLNLLSSGDGDPSKIKPLSLAANPTRATYSGVDNRSGPPTTCPATIISEFSARSFKILSSSRKIECSPKKIQNKFQYSRRLGSISYCDEVYYLRHCYQQQHYLRHKNSSFKQPHLLNLHGNLLLFPFSLLLFCFPLPASTFMCSVSHDLLISSVVI